MNNRRGNDDKHYEGVYYGSSDDNTLDDIILDGLVEDALLNDSHEQYLNDSQEDPDSSFDILADHGEFEYSEHDQREYTPALDVALLSSDPTLAAMTPIAEEDESDSDDMEAVGNLISPPPMPDEEFRSQPMHHGVRPISPPSLYDIPYAYNRAESDERSQSSVPSGSIKQSVHEIDGVLDEMQRAPSRSGGIILRNDDENSTISDASAINGGTRALELELQSANESFHSEYSRQNDDAESKNSERKSNKLAIMIAISLVLFIIIGSLVGVLVSRNAAAESSVESSQTFNASGDDTAPSFSPAFQRPEKRLPSLRPTLQPSLMSSISGSTLATGPNPSESHSFEASDSPSTPIPFPTLLPSTTMTSHPTDQMVPTAFGRVDPIQTDEEVDEMEESDKGNLSPGSNQRPWDDDDFHPIEIQGSDDFYSTDDTYDYHRHHPKAPEYGKKTSKANKHHHKQSPPRAKQQSTTKSKPKWAEVVKYPIVVDRPYTHPQKYGEYAASTRTVRKQPRSPRGY